MSTFLRWLDTNDVAFAVAVVVIVWTTAVFWIWCVVRSGARCRDLRPTPPRPPIREADVAVFDKFWRAEAELPAWRNADAALAARLIEDEALAMAEPNLTDEQRRAVVCARHRRTT